VPWVVAGVGGASLLGALGFELARRSAESAAEKASQLDYQGHFDTMESRQLTSRVLLGLGGALLVTGGVLYLIDSKKEPTAQVALACDGVGCGLSARGSFE
jgi:hypothetical protein